MSGKRSSKKAEKDRGQHLLLSRHHLQRCSSVRPFFCCGSQVSLNSIPELKDFPLERDKVQDDDYEDLSDSDHGDESDRAVQLNTTFTVENISSLEQNGKRSLRIAASKHKKTGLQEKNVTRKKFWTLKLKGKLSVSKRSPHSSDSELSSGRQSNELCVCTSYKSAGERSGREARASYGAEAGTSGTVTFPVSVIAHVVSPGSAPASSSSLASSEGACGTATSCRGHASGDKSDKLNPFVKLNELYPISDIDEQRIAQRQREMEHGIEVEHVDGRLWSDDFVTRVDDGFPAAGNAVVCSSSSASIVGPYPTYGAMGLMSTQNESPKPTIPPGWVCPSLGLGLEQFLVGNSFPDISQLGAPGVHTQVDYKHYLVPDIATIVDSSYYWGVMDRYQAEKLIENKPEGTFLLRDSAQDEFLFSVSFRRYGRSLHARIEQWNHKFSFDSRDPGVFATDTVCGLIEHYLDPSCCMFFEPMLTRPLHRTFPFSLQHLSRAIISTHITYDGINKLTLPKTLKEYLRFYHYKQKVRVRRFDNVA